MTIILILLFLTFSFAFGQNPQVSKEIKVTMTFDYNYMKDGKLYLSRKGVVRQDTLITEYNQDGKQKNPNKDPYVTVIKTINLDSVAVIFQNDTIGHQREFWSDTTFTDISIRIFPDSIIKTKILKGDTLQIEKIYNYGEVKRELATFNYGFYKRKVIYEETSKNRDIATMITTYFKNGLTDTVKIENYKKRNIYKTLIFNKDRKEWFVKEKIKSKKNKRVVWETFYHDYHKTYFTTKTTTTFNKFGLPILEIQYDTYLKHIEVKTTYEYEYY